MHKLKGKKQTPEHIAKRISNILNWEKRSYTKEYREQLRQKMLGNKNGFKKGFTPWNKGKEHKAVQGEKHHSWKGGVSPFSCKTRRLKLRTNGGSHTKEEWNELKKKWNFMCLCCKKQEPFIKLSEDHIIPIYMGGSDDISNIQPLCIACNSRKSIKIIDYSLLLKQSTVA
jgi:5-methylcytosine-specific restriction endonuclease McrA